MQNSYNFAQFFVDFIVLSRNYFNLYFSLAFQKRLWYGKFVSAFAPSMAGLFFSEEMGSVLLRSLYDSAGMEAGKLLVNSRIRRGNASKGYRPEMGLRFDLRQFFAGLDRERQRILPHNKKAGKPE